MNMTYDELSKIVNESYERTSDIRETMRETKLSFDLVWDMTGHKDEMDWTDAQDMPPHFLIGRFH